MEEKPARISARIHGGHRQHAVVGRGIADGVAAAAVACRRHDQDARSLRPLDRVGHRLAPGRGAEAHVDDVHAVLDGPINAHRHAGPRTRSGAVHDLHRVDGRLGRNANHADPVLPRGDDAANVRAVAIVVERLRTVHEVGAIHAAAGQILVPAIDARIDHRDLYPGAALAGDKGGGIRRSAPDGLGVDLIDAVFERFHIDGDGVRRVVLDVPDKRQVTQPLGVASHGDGATDADDAAHRRGLRRQFSRGNSEIGDANDETLLRMGSDADKRKSDGED